MLHSCINNVGPSSARNSDFPIPNFQFVCKNSICCKQFDLNECNNNAMVLRLHKIDCVNPNSAGLLNVPFSESEIRKRHEILEH